MTTCTQLSTPNHAQYPRTLDLSPVFNDHLYPAFNAQPRSVPAHVHVFPAFNVYLHPAFKPNHAQYPRTLAVVVDGLNAQDCLRDVEARVWLRDDVLAHQQRLRGVHHGPGFKRTSLTGACSKGAPHRSLLKGRPSQEPAQRATSQEPAQRATSQEPAQRATSLEPAQRVPLTGACSKGAPHRSLLKGQKVAQRSMVSGLPGGAGLRMKASQAACHNLSRP
eukprot:362329-Chlamydomonas_euryale.AAC.2